MDLIAKIEKQIWQDFGSYKNVKFYIKRWHQSNDSHDWNYYEENFRIIDENGKIDLSETLHGINSEILIKIAVDLGIETPNFISAVATIKNLLKQNYSTSLSSFKKCLEELEDNPDLSIGLANSTLESIIRHILEDEKITTKAMKGDTLYKLSNSILKEFALFPKQEMPKEIKTIGSSLLSLSQNIESLRSQKTVFHGKTKSDYVIEDPLYAYFIVNVVSTVGLFLIGFYEKKYATPKNVQENLSESELTDEVINSLPF